MIFMPSVMPMASSHVTVPSKLLSFMDCASDTGLCGGNDAMSDTRGQKLQQNNLSD